jgi:hypothetical protein
MNVVILYHTTSVVPLHFELAYTRVYCRKSLFADKRVTKVFVMNGSESAVVCQCLYCEQHSRRHKAVGI